MIKWIYGHQFVSWRSSHLPTGVSSTTWAELVSTSLSGTLWWQPSATSLCPTLYSKGWRNCLTRWALTLGIRANCVTIIWPTQTTFATIILQVPFTAILLNALSSLCNSLRSDNICCMLQYRNSTMVGNVSTQRWHLVTGGGISRHVVKFCRT